MNSSSLGWSFGTEYRWGSTASRSNFAQHNPAEMVQLSTIDLEDSFFVHQIIGGIASQIRMTDGTIINVQLNQQHRLAFASSKPQATQAQSSTADLIDAVKWYNKVFPNALELDPSLNEVIVAYERAMNRAEVLRDQIANATSELAEMDML